MSFFNKKNTATTPPELKADPTAITPQTAADYLKRGYAYYARQEFPQADEDFRKALALEPESAEAHYALGFNLKALGRKEEAVTAFQQALKYIDTLEEQNKVRAHMLARLAKGHINQIVKGDWDLRKDFWGEEAEQ